MDVGEWVRSLELLTTPNGWIGADNAGLARLARQVLDDFCSDVAWIGHEFPAATGPDGQAAKPDAAYSAQRRRDVMLCLAVAHELVTRRLRKGEGANDFGRLVHDVIEAALVAPTGLRPRAVAASAGPDPYEEADFAHSGRAKRFFEERVRLRLDKVDAAYRTGLVKYVGGGYDVGDDASIERWGRAWTACAAVAFLDWLKAKHITAPADIVRALWVGPLPNLHLRGGPLPAGARDVHLELRTRRLLAQIMQGRAEYWVPPPDAAVDIHIPIKANDYVAEAGVVTYRGREIRQIYLCVLVDLLSASNRGAQPIVP